jgi:crotonobetainyl-CoA:carnitine CoA-transferase CaiB-like acyl-CoA transferase
MRLLGGSADPGGASWLFKHYSRGKRAITLDLTAPEGLEALYRLIETADVFLTSYLAPTRKKLKIDVDDLRARNPQIIYARGSGQGPLGPEADRGGFDDASWSCRGSLADTTMKATGTDVMPGAIGHGDGMSGMTLVSGICAALARRARTGVPTVVDASLLGTAIWFNGPAIIESKRGGSSMFGMGPPRHERLANTNNYRTRDGRFIVLSMLGDYDTEWSDLCAHLGHPELATDPRFSTSAARATNRAAAVDLLDEIFVQRTYEEWKRILVTTKGVWGPVQTAREIHDDPQTIANGFVRDVQDVDGPLALPVPPILFDEEGGDPPRAPDFGEHSDEVMAELGYDAAEIARYRSAGIIA